MNPLLENFTNQALYFIICARLVLLLEFWRMIYFTFHFVITQSAILFGFSVLYILQRCCRFRMISYDAYILNAHIEIMNMKWLCIMFVCCQYFTRLFPSVFNCLDDRKDIAVLACKKYCFKFTFSHVFAEKLTKRSAWFIFS